MNQTNYRSIHNKALITVGLVLFFLAVKAQDTLAYWGFNETSGSTTMEARTQTAFSIKTKWPVIERVPGIRQSALRSDGYTFWVEGNVAHTFPADSFSVSFWLAPETYPVRTASIWSMVDPVTNRGAAIGIDKFGFLVASFMINNQQVNLVSSQRIGHWKWSFVVVNIDAVNGQCKAYINGVVVINQGFFPGTINWPVAKTILGRSASTEMQDIFPLNYFNGLYDEVLVRKGLWSASKVSEEYNNLNPPGPPVMATPVSRFANDFHRPKYHALPQSGWANESHGLQYYNGVYHMFFQKNGNGPFFSQQNWGHLTSPDLVNWEEVQPALFPQPGFESVGIWSGHCVLDDNNVPTIFYTAVDGVKAVIASARSTGELKIWDRSPANPLIPGAPSSYPNLDFRDPYVFKEGNTWYMIVGSGLQNPPTGTVFLYRSSDLQSWQFLHPLFIDRSGLNSPGRFWEMPVFWKFGNRYLLLVNKTPQGAIPARAFYWTGNFISDTFQVGNPVVKNLDIINSLLSPAVNLDAQNRVVAIGIIPDLLPQQEQYNNGWTHLFSLPRVWTLSNDSLFQSPHPNLDAGRGQQYSYNNISMASGTQHHLGLKGFQAEIKASIHPGNAGKLGFVLGKNDDGSEYTKIYYDITGQSFVVDRTKSSTNPNTPRDLQAEFFPLPAGQPIDWHIYLDGSVIEVFINNKWAFATRIFPVSSQSNGMDLFAEGGTALATSVQVWNRGGSIVTGIDPSPSVNNIGVKAWPVPASDHCYFSLPENIRGNYTISIFDASGRCVRRLRRSAGSSSFVLWDLKDSGGRKLSAGSYFARFDFANRTAFAGTVLIK